MSVHISDMPSIEEIQARLESEGVAVLFVVKSAASVNCRVEFMADCEAMRKLIGGVK